MTALCHTPPRRRQTGGVNMLLVSLAGLAALSITANNLGAINSTQESNLSFHANTAASTEAWRGVEIFRMYLEAAGNNLAVNDQLTVTDVSSLKASISAIQQKAANGTWQDTATIDSSKDYRVRLSITGSGNIAGAQRAIETIYQVSAPSSGGGGSSGGTLKLESVSIHSNLDLQGGIDIKGGTSANFMVDGNADLSGSVTGINELCATGDVTIRSGIEVTRVCSNKSVTIAQGAEVAKIVAIGQVNLNSGSASVGDVHSNADVVFNGGGVNATSVNASGNVKVLGGNARVTGTLNAEGNVQWTNRNSASTINANGNVEYRGNGAATINSRGNVTLLAGDSLVANVFALGWVDIYSTWNSGISNQLRGASWVNWLTGEGAIIGDGIVKGEIKGVRPTAYQPVINIRQDSNLVVDVPLVIVPKITPIVMTRPNIDVNEFKASANYVFFYENGKQRVTVRNVDGIDDGTYFIASYTTNNKNDYLCTELNAQGKCSKPTTPGKTLCMGFGSGNACFDQSSAGNWAFNGQSMAPGTAWFEGNLKLANGTFINTFLASGNITVAQGSVKIYSPNYLGYAGVCTDSKGVVNTDTRLAGIRPKDYCQGGTYTSSPLGNIALMAGSYSGTNYVGGDITLGASNKIYGTIMAGGLLKTSGSTTIVGALVVANTPKSSASTTIQGGVTVDLSSIPSTFSPDVAPCSGTNCGSSGGGSGSSTPSAEALWSRYL